MDRSSLITARGPRRALLVFGVALTLGILGAPYVSAQTTSDSGGLSARFVRADGTDSPRMRRADAQRQTAERCFDSQCAEREAQREEPRGTNRDREEPRREAQAQRERRREAPSDARTARRERPRSESASQTRERPSFSFGTRVSDVRERRQSESDGQQRRERSRGDREPSRSDRDGERIRR